MAVIEESSKKRSVKLALTCAPGGHFEQMQNLEDFYKDYHHFWITIRTAQTEHTLRGPETAYFVRHAHFKKPWTYLSQIPQFLRILIRERPTHILSTGAGVIEFVPFLFSRILKIKFIHIETFSRVHNPTLMGRFLLWLHHPILTQWDGILQKGAVYIGPILSDQRPPPRTKLHRNSVFVTLGTRPQKYTRILRAVESLIDKGVIKENVIAQTGTTTFRSDLMEIFNFGSPAQMDEYIAASRYIITQQSAGVVTKCLKMEKRFIVMPRLYDCGELPTRSDMEEDLHLKLAELGYTYVVNSRDQLEEAILKVDLLKTGYLFDNRPAVAYLRNIIETY